MTFSNTTAPQLRRIDATGLVRLSAPFVLLAVLLAPSIWMLTVIPTLWRDVDAYLQVTRPPGAETILQYGPLYCFGARIPLYLGYAIDSIKAGHSLPNPDFFIHPVLTDSGVFLLLVVQHAALCFAAFCLISVATGTFWVRVILALAWAANPLPYTLAHCVGGETLSMILIVLVGATGLRIVRHSRNVPKKEWFLVGILLWGCALTRQINAVLAGLLPLSFLLLALYRSCALRFAGQQSRARWNRLRSKRAFQKAMVAVGIGISAIVLANVSRVMLCYAVRIPYDSAAGFAFIDRLRFLAALPVEQRDQLIDKASRNANSADVRSLISLLREESIGGTRSWNTAAFKSKARRSFEGNPDQQQRYYRALNGMIAAFLWPPSRIFLGAVAADFERSQRITIPDVVAFLFVTTRFYFSHRDVMPQCASLSTFRDKDADQIFSIFKKHSYFRHPKNLSYRGFLFIWIVLFAAFVVIARARRLDVAGVASFAIALIVMAILIMLANCLLAIFQPRYTLPMWELTIVSLFILFGGTGNAFLYRSDPLHSRKLNGQQEGSAQV